uniref:Uncharacterized protein n=1 Tax=Anopheles merus TaxID=30066 RepID=A0A182VDZ7_ANOME
MHIQSRKPSALLRTIEHSDWCGDPFVSVALFVVSAGKGSTGPFSQHSIPSFHSVTLALRFLAPSIRRELSFESLAYQQQRAYAGRMQECPPPEPVQEMAKNTQDALLEMGRNLIGTLVPLPVVVIRTRPDGSGMIDFRAN